MSDFDPDNFECFTLGPAWARDDDGKFVLPERSLGYEALRWTYKYLKHGDKPWKYTAEQARLILWWYAIDENGDFIFKDGVIQRMKGWGKDPLIATICAFELCGPCRFDHWDENGKPVGKQPAEPWIQVAAVSKTQTQNTMKLFRSLFTKEALKVFDIKLGAELIKAQGGVGQIEAVTSSPETLEGGRPSLFIMNETHHWNKSNKGTGMALTGRDNAQAKGGRDLAITNAYQPGMGSVGQSDREAFEDVMAGRAEDTGTMYDTLEAPPNAPLERSVLAKVLYAVQGDSHWQPVEKLIRKVMDKRTPRSRARRMYYNQVVATEDALISAAEWDPCADRTLKLEPGDEITLGLDPSKNDDSTALVALRLRDSAFFVLGLWELPEDWDEEVLGPWQVDMELVDAAVHSAFIRYKVRAFFSDVYPAESYINKWNNEFRDDLLIKASAGKSAIGYDMRGHHKEIAEFNEALVGSIRDQAIKHTGDLALRIHVLNTISLPTNWDTVSFTKESRESKRKIDAYASMVLAYIAMIKYLESGKKPKVPKGRRGWIR